MGRCDLWCPLYRGAGFVRAAARVLACVAIVAGALGSTSSALAAEHLVPPGTPLQPVIEAAVAGDVIRLAAGRHAGPIALDRTLSLVGEPGAVLAGPGVGSVVTVTAPDVQIRGLQISGSGIDVAEMDSAILVLESAPRADIRNNHLVGNLFGVYLHGAGGSVVRDNIIRGRTDLRMAEAGNGVSIWNAPGAKVIGNTISHGRDGIFVKVSTRNSFENNTFSDLRFAIHYMYANDSRIIGNRSRGNHVGWAIMYSDRLQIRDNVSDNDRDHGLMLNSTNNSQVIGNVVRGGGEKCVFVYNANGNRIAENWFEGCPIGIHFTAGSEGNSMTGNAFVANQMQVKYVGTRYLDWASEGRGNYWSDNPAYDLNGDGIADRPYRPNDVMDEILWTLPQAKALISSPAVQMVRWAQAHFPALYPGGVVDTAPLMRPPPMSRRASP
ncbi:MAG: nitrous oxide reductase family maturation protein NosD [Thermomonas sp.]